VKLISIKELLADYIQISIPSLNKEIKNKRLKIVKIGGRKFVTENGLKDYYKLLEAEAKAANWE